MIHALWKYLLTEKSSTTPQLGFLNQQITVTNPKEMHERTEESRITMKWENFCVYKKQKLKI